MVENHAVIVSMPKSASVFVRTAIEMTAGLQRHSFGGPLPFLETADTQAFHRFLGTERAQGGQHMAASPFNLAMLREGGIDRVTLLLRDPREALVSWLHNLERDDIDRLGWHRTMLVAADLMPPDYYDLDRDGKVASLFDLYLPRLMSWQEAWKAVSTINIHTINYSDLIKDEKATIASILDFHGVDYSDIHLPEIDKSTELDTKTHFRRGIIGSHLDELNFAQRMTMEARLLSVLPTGRASEA